MAATAVSGLDLYFRAEDGTWRWIAVGRPTGPTTTAELVAGLPAGTREYLLYLPLFNRVASVEIGLPRGATLRKADARPADRAKPIVFYGTSITHGACASRPGMTHPAILGRRLDRPVINLGFSGNGKLDPEIAALLAELDPAAFVIDCLPNMGGDAEAIAGRAPNLVKTIRAKHPTTPILLVEDRTRAEAFLKDEFRRMHASNRAALRQAYESLVAAGDRHLAYLPGDKLLAADGDDTVDGSHPSDLGFARHADVFQPALEALLRGE
jgi:lysophospholipase L1-like esterase